MKEEARARETPCEEQAGAPANAPMGAIPLANAIGARNLLIIIVTMPLFFLLVVLATLAIFGGPGARRPEKAAAEAEIARPDQPAPISLPAGASIAAMTLDGDRLALAVETETGGEIVVYDLARGAVLLRIEMTAGEGGI